MSTNILDSKLVSQAYTKKLIRVSAHDNIAPGSSTEDFKVNFPGPNSTLANVSSYRIQTVSLRNVFYNVNRFTNKLKFYISSQPATHYELTVKSGFYNATTLAGYLKREIEALVVGNILGFTIDLIPNKEALSGTDADTDKYTVDYNIPANTLVIEEGSSHSRIIGFGVEDITQDTILLDGAELPYQFNLSGQDAIYIHSNALSTLGYDFDTKNQVNIILTVPMTSEAGGNLDFINPSDVLTTFPRPRDLNNLDFRIRNNRGELLNMNQSDWTVVIEIYARN